MENNHSENGRNGSVILRCGKGQILAKASGSKEHIDKHSRRAGNACRISLGVGRAPGNLVQKTACYEMLCRPSDLDFLNVPIAKKIAKVRNVLFES